MLLLHTHGGLRKKMGCRVASRDAAATNDAAADDDGAVAAAIAAAAVALLLLLLLMLVSHLRCIGLLHLSCCCG